MQSLLFTLLFDVLALASGDFASGKSPNCPEASACIERVRKSVADDARFWFGEQWRRNCGARHRDPVHCSNPTALQKFTSLGGRLFHVKFYHPNYLSNLKVFPRITYAVSPGSYRACDHDFHLLNGTVIEADPDMDPVEPFQIRDAPNIHWPEMNDGHSYVLAMIDAGFGTLNYLVYNFPKKPMTVKAYEPSENFRPSANPLVLLVFRQAHHNQRKIALPGGGEPLFDLTRFMIDNELEHGLIGINWVVVTNDAYAIEKQRLRGVVDNCHSLVESKLLRDRRWAFTSSLPLGDLDSWLSVSYQQPKLSLTVCCTRFWLKSQAVPLDPLGDGLVTSAAVHKQPRVSVLRTPMASETYQRTSRHYVAMIDQRFTLVLFDATANRLHWLVVDIPSASLAAGALDDGEQVLPYLAPIPPSPSVCRTFVFLLFMQSSTQSSSQSAATIAGHFPREHAYRSAYCKDDCLQRNDFNAESLAARHRLRLSAVNWMNVCYDAFEAHRKIGISRANLNLTDNSAKANLDKFDETDMDSDAGQDGETPPHSATKRRRVEKWAAFAAPPTVDQLGPETKICMAMNLTVDLTCPDGASCTKMSHLLCVVVLPLFLLLRN